MCTGIFKRLRPLMFTDPMVGGGTSVEVAREMRIEAHGLDLHSGFNILKHRILDEVGKPSDLVSFQLSFQYRARGISPALLLW